MVLEIILIILGFILLIKGADILVEGGSDLAKKMRIPEIIIGLTIVSIGTSMPELVVSITSALEGHPDMAIGNVVGSNITNLFLILGVCAVINELKFQKQTIKIEIPITLIATVMLIYFANNSKGINIITQKEGLVLIAICIIFILYNLINAIKQSKQQKTLIEINYKNNKEIKLYKSIFFILLGIAGLKVGGDLIINNSVIVASKIGMSDKLISLTILAIATSLPELITSITAAIKGENDMAIGNVLGSQIFNILLIIGLSAVICPLNYSVEYNKNLYLLFVGAVLLMIFPHTGNKNKITKIKGVVFLIFYGLYIYTLAITK